MYRFLLSLCLAIGLACSVHAQTVAGLRFGTPYATARDYLYQRYGKPNSIDYKVITYRNLTLGGFFFEHVLFFFSTSDKGVSYLQAVKMLRPKGSADQAEKDLSNLYQCLTPKYTFSRYPFADRFSQGRYRGFLRNLPANQFTLTLYLSNYTKRCSPFAYAAELLYTAPSFDYTPKDEL